MRGNDNSEDVQFNRTTRSSSKSRSSSIGRGCGEAGPAKYLLLRCLVGRGNDSRLATSSRRSARARRLEVATATPDIILQSGSVGRNTGRKRDSWRKQSIQNSRHPGIEDDKMDQPPHEGDAVGDGCMTSPSISHPLIGLVDYHLPVLELLSETRKQNILTAQG